MLSVIRYKSNSLRKSYFNEERLMEVAFQSEIIFHCNKSFTSRFRDKEILVRNSASSKARTGCLFTLLQERATVMKTNRSDGSCTLITWGDEWVDRRLMGHQYINAVKLIKNWKRKGHRTKRCKEGPGVIREEKGSRIIARSAMSHEVVIFFPPRRFCQ